MELNCPNCTTHFTVPDDAIGPKGRKLKCAMCGHTWRQMPAGSDVAPEPHLAASASYGGGPDPVDDPSYDTDMDDDWNAALDDDGNDDGESWDSPANDTPAVPMEMAPTRGSVKRDPLDGYNSDIPMESGSPRRPATNDDDDPLQGLDFGSNSPFGSSSYGDDDQDELSSFSRRPDPSSEDVDDFLAAGPQPIADLFGRDNDDDDDHEDEGGKGKGGLIAILLILVMAGLGAGAWFGRSTLVTMVPALEPVYAMLGVEVDVSSTGLVFQDVASDRQSVNGVDMFVVRGFITNESDAKRVLPHLSLILFDRTDSPVQKIVSEPPQKELEPGQTTGFRIKLESPAASATRFDVFWTKPPKTQTGESDAPAEGSH